MYFTQVCCILIAVAGYASAKGYGFGGLGGGAGGGGYGGGGYGGGGYGGGGYGAGGYGGGQEDQKPKPFNFGYEAPSGGGSHFRKEQGDGSGSVQGSYGYTDEQGLYRKVDYVADAGGFKASVKTNEPGTDGKENPADVIMNVQSPPPGVQEKYNRPSYGVGGFGGPKPGFGGNGGGYGGGGHAGFGGGAGAPDFGGMMMAKFGGGGGMFAGIPRSTSGKSGY